MAERGGFESPIRLYKTLGNMPNIRQIGLMNENHFSLPVSTLCKDYTMLFLNFVSLADMMTNPAGSLEIVYDYRRAIEEIIRSFI